MYNVYLISCGTENNRRYKIGYTRGEVSKRVKQLRTGNSEDLIIESIYKSKWGTKIESVLHRNYKNYRLSGEWFVLNQKQVDNFLDDCHNLETFFEDWIENSTFKNPKTLLR